MSTMIITLWQSVGLLSFSRCEVMRAIDRLYTVVSNDDMKYDEGRIHSPKLKGMKCIRKYPQI